jgi:hypothetical protein
MSKRKKRNSRPFHRGHRELRKVQAEANAKALKLLRWVGADRDRLADLASKSPDELSEGLLELIDEHDDDLPTTQGETR